MPTALNQFQLKDGPQTVAHYGLVLASVAGLPVPVIESAKSITSKITQKVHFPNQHVSILFDAYLTYASWNIITTIFHVLTVLISLKLCKR